MVARRAMLGIHYIGENEMGIKTACPDCNGTGYLTTSCDCAFPGISYECPRCGDEIDRQLAYDTGADIDDGLTDEEK